MDAFIVVDMQEDMLLGPPKFRLEAVVESINDLAEGIRSNGGKIIFIQHDGDAEGEFMPLTPGWNIMKAIRTSGDDLIVHKSTNDAFFETSLLAELRKLDIDRLIVGGWATDLCVNSTVRTAVNLGFRVVIAKNCHTVGDRGDLKAWQVINYHHWMWKNLISRHIVQIHSSNEILNDSK